MNMTVLPPDVNESFPGFAVVPGTRNIRWGLQAIKNVGTEIAEIIVKERKKNGEFVDLADFLSRIHANSFNKKTLEALIKTGALDRFESRSKLYGNMDQLLLYNKHVQASADRSQVSLFDFAPTIAEAKISLKAVPEVSKSEVLGWEKELLGLYVTTHPGAIFAEAFEGGVTKCVDVALMNDDDPIRTAGVIVNVKQIFTKKKNEPMAFVRLEDASGSAEVVVFPKTYAKVRDRLLVENLVLIKGKIAVREREWGDEKNIERSVLCDSIITFTESDVPKLSPMIRQGGWPDEEGNDPSTMTHAPSTEVDGVIITAPAKPSHDMITKLREIFESSPGRDRVYLVVESGGQMRKIATEYSIKRNHDVLEKISAIVGPQNVR